MISAQYLELQNSSIKIAQDFAQATSLASCGRQYSR